MASPGVPREASGALAKLGTDQREAFCVRVHEKDHIGLLPADQPEDGRRGGLAAGSKGRIERHEGPG
jgi:hypothetical protein